MAIITRVLFGQPQREIASQISSAWSRCQTASVVAGFATISGIEAVFRRVVIRPTTLETMVLGASTFKGFEALDRFVAMGVDPAALHVHLGHTAMKRRGARRNPFFRYHPMLHSKIYYFEHGNATASAFIGSHNMTGFALMGMNGEASVLIEGDADDSTMAEVRDHIEESRAQSVQYDPFMKEAYAWWYQQAVDGLTRLLKDRPHEYENTITVIVLAQVSNIARLKKGDIIYLELPKAIHQVRSIGTEFHVFLFDLIPDTPEKALARISTAKQMLLCKTEGLEDDQGGRELAVDWEVRRGPPASLTTATTPFRPTPRPDYTQIRIRIHRSIRDRYKYLFDRGQDRWLPKFDHEAKIRIAANDSELLDSLPLTSPENVEWQLVNGLSAAAGDDHDLKPRMREAYRETSPSSGNYVLISRRRRKLREPEGA